MATQPIRLVAVGGLFAAILLVSGCTDFNKTKSSEGVVLHGCGKNDNAWLENTNTFPVRIRRVWQGYGEGTQSIDVLQPGEKLKFKVDSQHGFYIYTLEGTNIGWFTGKC